MNVMFAVKLDVTPIREPIAPGIWVRTPGGCCPQGVGIKNHPVPTPSHAAGATIESHRDAFIGDV